MDISKDKNMSRKHQLDDIGKDDHISKKIKLSKKNKSEEKEKNENIVLRKIVSNLIPNIDTLNLNKCCICYSKFNDDNIIIIKKCTHFYCKDCFRIYMALGLFCKKIMLQI